MRVLPGQGWPPAGSSECCRMTLECPGVTPAAKRTQRACRPRDGERRCRKAGKRGSRRRHGAVGLNSGRARGRLLADGCMLEGVGKPDVRNFRGGGWKRGLWRTNPPRNRKGGAGPPKGARASVPNDDVAEGMYATQQVRVPARPRWPPGILGPRLRSVHRGRAGRVMEPRNSGARGRERGERPCSGLGGGGTQGSRGRYARVVQEPGISRLLHR